MAYYYVWRGKSSSPMNSGIGGTPSPRNNRMMWRTLFGTSSNSVPPSVSRTAQKLAVPVSRRCASCGLESAGRPLRTLYAFNPLRSAILLIGGEKTGDDRWYEKFVPIADRLFERHLLELKKEGSI